MPGVSERPWSRREFIGAAAVGLVGFWPDPAAAEPPPETTRVRVNHSGSLCQAPQYVAEDLLRSEGFTDVQYVRPRGPGPAGLYQALGSGEIDIGGDFAPTAIIHLDRGAPVA